MTDMNRSGRMMMPLIAQTSSALMAEAPQTTWLTRAQDFIGELATPLNVTRIRNLRAQVENEAEAQHRITLDHALAIVFLESLLHNIEVATANDKRQPLNNDQRSKAAMFAQFNNREGRIT